MNTTWRLSEHLPARARVHALAQVRNLFGSADSVIMASGDGFVAVRSLMAMATTLAWIIAGSLAAVSVGAVVYLDRLGRSPDDRSTLTAARTDSRWIPANPSAERSKSPRPTSPTGLRASARCQCSARNDSSLLRHSQPASQGSES